MRDTSDRVDCVEAMLNFLADMEKKPVIDMNTIGSGIPTRLPDECYVAHKVTVHNARAGDLNPSLDREGFILRQLSTNVSDFFDKQNVQRIYYAEIEKEIKELTGAIKVIVFDHTIRLESVDKQRKMGTREVVRIAHNDYTQGSGPQRVQDLVEPQEATHRLHNRFAIYNVCRPVIGAVESMPLGLCSANSVLCSNLAATDLDYGERMGEIYHLSFHPEQQWFYFPKMSVEEVIIFKSYDSMTDGRARFTPHTGFTDPTSPAHAAPRESIEVRALALYE